MTPSDHPENQIFEDDSEQDEEITSGAGIKSTVTIHDRNNVEFVFDYSFEPKAKATEDPDESSPPIYEVEAFFFFPPQMGISSNLYTKRQFYDDIRPLYRLREPRFGFKEFFAKESSSHLTPIHRLYEVLANNKSLGDKEVKICIFQARLFACIFSNYFMRRVNRRVRKIERFGRTGKNPHDAENSARLIDRCQVLVERASSLVKLWEDAFKAFASATFETVHLRDEMMFEMSLVDEFCHYKLSEGVARMAAHWQTSNLVQRGLLADAHKIQLLLRRWSRWHRSKLRKKGYLTVDESSSLAEQEHYFFRRGDLKKRMWQILYLDLEPRRSLEFQKQVAYMIAAGVAASWAFFAQVLISYQLNFSGDGSSLDSLLNASGFAVLMAFIGAYVLKDRIKDIGREWFRSGLFGGSPDFSYKVWFHYLGRMNSCIGSIVESTDFYERAKANKVPKEVINKRRELPGHLVSFNEKVVHYRQKLSLEKMDEIANMGPIWAIRSIFRFNLRRYLDYLDDSLQKHSVLNREGQVSVISFPKVYHLDVILRYAYTNEKGRRSYVGLDCNRLIVGKEGLIRVESP